MMTEAPQQEPLLEDEPFPLELMSLASGDMALTPEQQAELEADPEAKALLDSITADTEDNPFADKGLDELIKIYLNNSTRGVRWLSEKTNISRKIIRDFIDGKRPDIDSESVERMVDVISKDYADWSRRQEEKAAATSIDDPGITVDPEVGKVPVKAVQPPAGLNRQERRKWLADFRAGKIKESTKPTYPRGQSPIFVHYD